MLYGMRKLEYNAENKTGYKSKDHKAYEPIQPTYHGDGQHDKKEVVNQFGYPKDEVVIQLHFLQRHFTYFSPEVFLVVENKNPEKIKE